MTIQNKKFCRITTQTTDSVNGMGKWGEGWARTKGLT